MFPLCTTLLESKIVNDFYCIILFPVCFYGFKNINILPSARIDDIDTTCIKSKSSTENNVSISKLLDKLQNPNKKTVDVTDDAKLCQVNNKIKIIDLSSSSLDVCKNTLFCKSTKQKNQYECISIKDKCKSVRKRKVSSNNRLDETDDLS